MRRGVHSRTLASMWDIFVQASPAEQALLIIGFNLIMFVVIEAPLIAYLLAPDRARGDVTGGLGLYLVVKGVAAL